MSVFLQASQDILDRLQQLDCPNAVEHLQFHYGDGLAPVRCFYNKVHCTAAGDSSEAGTEAVEMDGNGIDRRDAILYIAVMPPS